MDDTDDTSVQGLVSVDRATMTRGQILDHLSLLRVVLAQLSASLERDIGAVSDPAGDEKDWDREEIGCVLGGGSGSPRRGSCRPTSSRTSCPRLWMRWPRG